MQHVDRLYGGKFHAKGHNLLLELNKRYDAALEEFDVLVMPTATHVASTIPPKDCSFKDIMKSAQSMNFNTKPFNSTGHPALTINAGFSAPEERGKRGLPIGMMIVGRQFDEVTVLQVARAFEKLSN
ncbi:hypothetical protein V1264_019294 [Littorina saxatilis]|uniref:Amidase domain-containing protein n=1 Tax=Littorina saxatilis TaxID=31220 RepID=A0AAN9BGA6_9CAEN